MLSRRTLFKTIAAVGFGSAFTPRFGEAAALSHGLSVGRLSGTLQSKQSSAREPEGLISNLMAIERLENVRRNYGEFAKVVGVHMPEAQRSALAGIADEAGAALEGYREWLTANRSRFTAPYVWGKQNFEWYVKRVLMMPYDSQSTWPPR